MSVRATLREIEARGDAPALVFVASRLDIDLLPPLYEALRDIGRVPRLQVVVQCRGGETNAARRIALLLHEFADELVFVVPHFCESAGTVMALGAHRIVAGPLAIFSPIDPHLSAEAGGRGPSSMSVQDLRQFWRMAQDWFGLDEAAAKAHALQTLGQSIFPTTLTSFHRCALEVQAMGEELLGRHMADHPAGERARIVDTLLHGFHSHTHALSRDDLRRIGLPVTSDPELEDAAWAVIRGLRGHVGPETRIDEESPWCDAAIVTATQAVRRQRDYRTPVPRWSTFDPDATP
jgi:Serine dehydrogenase proteinase